MFKYFRVVNGPLETNSYIVFCDKTKEGIIIDPCAADKIADAVDESGITPVMIVNTHYHADHVSGNKALKEKYSIPIAIHSDDASYLTSPLNNLEGYGLKSAGSPPADVILSDREVVAFGDIKLNVIHTPGHSPGGVCLYYPREVLFSGDTLFAMGVGRTDLPGGSEDALINSIKSRIFNLPDDVKVFPGHGRETTVGEEKKGKIF
ncbi:MAG: MBL fold metallo-hydrolase, partial [Candidatus Aureabacteria bacterium]|nr:MBL fold metallo-hydrolase [Candidatus Auribacterota bacterium]MCK5161743.1 MBL fold metallo-hydrolase [Candidatus Auribacterota bacterium]